MNLQNLRDNYPKLISYMETNDYSKTYIDRFKREIKKIIAAVAIFRFSAKMPFSRRLMDSLSPTLTQPEKPLSQKSKAIQNLWFMHNQQYLWRLSCCPTDIAPSVLVILTMDLSMLSKALMQHIHSISSLISAPPPLLPEILSPGRFEIPLTYPQFYKLNGLLVLLYRTEKRIEYFNYDTRLSAWTPDMSTVLMQVDAATSSVYIDRVATRDNYIFISWMYRYPSTTNNEILNEGLYMMYSDDYGQTWNNKNERNITLPVTPDKAVKIVDIPYDKQRINQCSTYLDGDYNLYIVDVRRNPQSIHQVFISRYNAAENEYYEEQISCNTAFYDLNGSGTLVLPLSRPEIAIDLNDIIHVIYRQSDKLIIALER